MTKTMLCLEDITVPLLKILCLTWTPKGSRRMHDIGSLLKAEIWNYSIFHKMRLLSSFKYPIQAVKTFIKLAKTKPNIVVVQDPPIFAALTCLIYGKLSRTKIVIDHHSIWSMAEVIKNPIAKSLVDSVEKLCIKKADLNITYADPWEYELTRMGAEKALTIYDFVDETWTKGADFSVREEFPKDKKIIVISGGGHPLERHDLLIEACNDLNAIVVITGEKKFLQKYIARAQELKTKNVIFAGFLPDKQYRGLIATCDFVANISEQPYGIPHVVIEALASKRPIIINKNSAVEKLLGKDCPFIIPDNDVDTVRSSFLSAFENQREYEKLAAKLYQRLKKRTEEQLENLFKFIWQPA